MAKREARVTLTSLERKIDASADKLDEKIDASVDRLDENFDQLENKVDRLDHKIDVRFDEAKRHASVLFEATKNEIRQVADAVTALNEKVGRFVDQAPQTAGDVDMRKLVYRDLDRRVTHLEEGSTHQKG